MLFSDDRFCRLPKGLSINYITGGGGWCMVKELGGGSEGGVEYGREAERYMEWSMIFPQD